MTKKNSQNLDIQSIIKEFSGVLDAFLGSRLNRQHLSVGPVTVYLRKSKRYVSFDGETKAHFENCLDIASIDIDESSRRQGLGGSIIQLVIDKNPFNLTLVESIVNPDLARYLARRGWILQGDAICPNAYWRSDIQNIDQSKLDFSDIESNQVENYGKPKP